MASFRKISVLALLYLISIPAWSRQVDFCKVIRAYDEKDLGAPPQISYEDCSGIAFLDYARDLVKASCWPGAVDLQPGKCERNDGQDSGDEVEANENVESEAEIGLF